jgi:hypothetical protein
MEVDSRHLERPRRTPTPVVQAALALLVAGTLITFSFLAFRTGFAEQPRGPIAVAEPGGTDRRPLVLPSPERVTEEPRRPRETQPVATAGAPEVSEPALVADDAEDADEAPEGSRDDGGERSGAPVPDGDGKREATRETPDKHYGKGHSKHQNKKSKADHSKGHAKPKDKPKRSHGPPPASGHKKHGDHSKGRGHQKHGH